MKFKIHHLNCGCFCPKSSLNFFPTQTLSCHCLLIETEVGLVLVDSGLPRDEIHYKQHWLRENLIRPQMPLGHSAYDQVQKMGFSAKDVRHILITHIDWDHVGGLIDFPEAVVHVHELEAHIMQKKSTMSLRFHSQFWKQVKKIESYDHFGETWKGFKSTRELRGLPSDILLVPLPGHTNGHSGIAIEQADQALLHAGDAFYFQEDLNFNLKERNTASDLLQFSMATNNWQRLNSLTKLSHFHARDPDVLLINSHDPRLIPGNI